MTSSSALCLPAHRFQPPVVTGFPQMIHGVAVSAGGGIGRDAEDFRDAGKGEVFPDLEMDDGALFLRQTGQGAGDDQG
jgi:hypothetical protein